jgi:hypothetical protein
LRDIQLLFFLRWPSASSNNDAIFSQKHKGNLCPFKKHFYQTVQSLQSTFPNNSNGMICAVLNTTSIFFVSPTLSGVAWIFVRWRVSNSKCQRWIHVSNHIKKWISFYFCNVIALLCRKMLFFYDSYSLSSSFSSRSMENYI